MSDTQRAHDPAALHLSWDDSHAGEMALLPSGPVWPRDREGVLSKTVRGLAGVHWRAWLRVNNMLDEADPRTCYETIRMWEIDCGLPDPCLENPPSSIEGRRAAIIARRQEGATTTPMDFVEFSARLGYDVEVIEFRPFRCWSNCDDALNTAPDWPHTWQVHILNPDDVLYVMTCRSPCNAFLREWLQGQLECAITRIAPAQTEVIFSYAFPPP